MRQARAARGQRGGDGAGAGADRGGAVRAVAAARAAARPAALGAVRVLRRHRRRHAVPALLPRYCQVRYNTNIYYFLVFNILKVRDRVLANLGLPPARCCDDLRKRAGSVWMLKATDRSMWCALGAAYVRQWAATG